MKLAGTAKPLVKRAKELYGKLKFNPTNAHKKAKKECGKMVHNQGHKYKDKP